MPATQDDAPRRPLRPRTVVHAFVVAVGLTVVLYIGYVLAGSNLHTVIPGEVYRCAQPSAAQLERLVREQGVRTVVNLRGCCDPLVWYVEECVTSNRLDISQEDVGFSAARLPSVASLRQLVEVLDRSEYPILFHCHKGADRSGLASAIALLLCADATLEQASGQLSPLYGHLSIGRTVFIDQFFDLYKEWLVAKGLEHSKETFRRWVMTEYCPAECRCELEALAPVPPQPLRVASGRTFPFRVRCRNTSVKPWELTPDLRAGAHAGFVVLNQEGIVVSDGRGGLFEATVAPGEHLDLTLAVPAPVDPGRYELRVDMVNEQHASFMQLGSEPLCWDLEVVP